jgi:hypothetical protein
MCAAERALNRRGKRGGASKSNREANINNIISIIAIQLGCVRINCQQNYSASW